MKDKIIIGILQAISFVCGFILIAIIVIVFSWIWSFIILYTLWIISLINDADKEFEKRTPENKKLIEQLDDELSGNFIIEPQSTINKSKPELLQVAEMYRDDMQGSPAEGSLAYMATVKAIDNYYKKAN